MIVSLLPVSALATDGGRPDSGADVVCMELEGCIDGNHDPQCPLYVSPEGPPAEETACSKLPGCNGVAHDPECPLYTPPGSLPPDTPEEVQSFLDAVEALDPETLDPEAVAEAWAAYDALTEEQWEREDVAEAYAALLATEELLAAMNAVPAAEDGVIYVSEDGDDTANGATEETATTLAHATELANEQTGPVTITIIGSVSVEDWDSPTVDTTIIGQNEESELLFEYCSANDYQTNIDMQGKLTIDQIKLNVNYTKPGLITSMPKTGTFTIVANGNPLEITADAEYIYDTGRTSVAHIIGGSLGEDLESNTNIKICTALPVTYVVGGCYDGTLTGDTNIWMEDSTVQCVIGGGEANERDSHVNGNTNITAIRTDIKNFMSGGGWTGQFPSASANVTENTNIHFESTRSGRVTVYGGGVCTDSNYTATVGGDVSITSTSNDMSSNSGTVYGGGKGSSSNMDNAKVDGDISITVEDGYSFGYIYGGGHNANVGGNVSIEVSGDNEKIGPSIYGGGEGYSKDQRTHVAGTVDITLNGAWSTVCSLGKYGTVGGKVTIYLKSGGGELKDTIFTQNILNADASYINSFGNVSGSPEYYENAEVIVSDGTFVATTIYGAPQITIKDGGVLQEQREYNSDNNKALFKDIQHVTIESGGTLALLQTNEISGTANCAGTLTMPQSAELIAGGAVTVSDGAMYVPTDGYENGDVFLQSKTAFTQSDQPEFAVNANGEAEGYFTKNRTAPGGSIAHEWYVSQLFTLKPLELTKYMAGDHDHADANCFPDPRFEGIGANTEIKVAGQIWNRAEHNGQYPFQIMYYPLPENYNLDRFPEGITDSAFTAPLADDHDAGTYIARVEPNSGIKLSDIEIDGRKIKTELSLLHIRKVEKVDLVGDGIDHLASEVVAVPPTQKVTEAVAVIGADVQYLVNNIAGQLLNPDPDIRLLQDEVLSVESAEDEDQYVLAMWQRLLKEYPQLNDAPRKYSMKYLDLIDANDSNLLVCAQAPYQIYIPYPAGTDQNTEFALFYFGGLNRTYTEQDYGQNVFENIKNSKVIEFEIEKTEAGIVFTVAPPPENQSDNYSIGAMALTWTLAQHTVTFDSNGGSPVPAQAVTAGDKATEPEDPTRDGYDFAGWYLGEVKYNFDTPVTEDITLVARWTERLAQYTVTFDSAGGSSVPTQTVTAGDKATEPKDPTRRGYDFDGWYLEGKKYDFDTPVTADITLVARWSRQGGGSETIHYILSYDSNGGTRYKDETYRKNTVVKLDKVPVREGYTFTGWYADKALTRPIDEIKMTSDKTVYAGWTRSYIPGDLNHRDHMAYVSGYPDGTVRPNASVTRAETATMLYRLLTDARREEIETAVIPFHDVTPTSWYAQAVAAMANGGYITGYEDGTFGGNKPITRAEFVAMLVRFIGLEEAQCSFTDVSRTHWAYEHIATATAAEWIGGYPDGTFGPSRSITRAEAMTIINRVLDRGVNEESALPDFKVWPDNPETAWFYYEVIEATNDHEYTGSRPSEDWTRVR